MAIARVNQDISGYLDSGSTTGGSLPSFSFDPGVGDFMVLSIAGYRSSSATLSFTPTINGVSPVAAGPVEWSNNTNTSNSSFQQFFVLTGQTSGAKTIAGNWSGNSGFASPKLKVAALSYSGVDSYGGFASTGGSASGTSMSQTLSSAAGRVIVQHFMVDVLSTADDTTGYNQEQIFAWETGANGNGVLGQADGAPSVTFSATRGVDGADWLTAAFELVPPDAGVGGASNMMMVM